MDFCRKRLLFISICAIIIPTKTTFVFIGIIIMLAKERRNKILEELHENKKVIVSDLSKRFRVSEETIRRDLEIFEREGIAVKGYGGAILNNDNKVELPFLTRKKKNIPEKQKIGDLAAGIVPDGSSILLDASSTSVFIARALKKKKNLTVITNSLEILMELSSKEDFVICGTGGVLNARRLAFEGSQTELQIRGYHTDYAFVSCKGIDKDMGITDFEDNLTGIQRSMLEAADQKIVAIDHTKFGQKAFIRTIELPKIDMLITDDNPGDDWIGFFESCDVSCRYKEQNLL